MTSLPLITHDRPALGLIVLRVDETIEDEFRAAIPTQSARLHISRIPSGDNLTPDSIGAMKAELTRAASLLPAAAGFDVVGYACTSATAALGADGVHALIKDGIPTKQVTDPLSAACAYLKSKGATRVGIVSPYTADVATPLLEAFRRAGFEVADSLSLNQSDEATVARIAPDAICDAARTLVKRASCDALLLSCTNLRTADLRAPLAAELGLPVTSSNHALAWHMQRLATKPM